MLSSHLFGEVEQSCDRVGVISRGCLIAESTVEELRGKGALLVAAKPLDRARERAERLLGPGRVAAAGGTLRLEADPATVGRINRELVGAGDASAGLADTLRREPLLLAWVLFTAVWLRFPAGFVFEVWRRDLPPLQLIAFLASMAVFVVLFLWVMLRYPFPVTGLASRELGVRIGLLLALSALALYVEIVYGGGVPYRLMYVVVPAAVILPTRHASWMVAAVAAFAGAFYAIRVGWDAFATNWGDIVPFALVGIGLIAVSRLVITIRELRAARREIAHLAAAEAVARERLRFARDLHDLLGHSLSSITLESELAARLLPDAPGTREAAAEVRDIQRVARGALREVREAVAGYRQPTLGEELAGAREIIEAAGIACRIDNGADLLPESVDGVLAWMVREGTTNLIRHSRAYSCEIRLTRDGGRVLAEITDDGRGSSPEDGVTATGSGLSSLAERVAASGGEFEAGPRPEGGFRLRASLPLPNDGLRQGKQR